MDRDDVNDDVRAVFIMVLATVLRCYPLRPEFIANKGVERVLGVLDEKSDVIVEAVSYLIGYRVDTCPLMCSLLGQDKQYRHFILTKRYSFIETLCSLDHHSSSTGAAMLFALQSFILEDETKTVVVKNTFDVLSNLIRCCRGEVRDVPLTHG